VRRRIANRGCQIDRPRSTRTSPIRGSELPNLDKTPFSNSLVGQSKMSTETIERSVCVLALAVAAMPFALPCFSDRDPAALTKGEFEELWTSAR
jgi:hypothetical protein